MGTTSLAFVCPRSPSRSQPTPDGIFAILPLGLPTNGSRSSARICRLQREPREKSGDPRESIAERYLDREDYLNRYSGAVDELVKQRWILAEDRRALLKRGEQEWDYATK